MEQTGVMSEEAWASLGGMYTSGEEAELLTQLLSGFSHPNEVARAAAFWPGDETSHDSSSVEMSGDLTMTMCFMDGSFLVGSDSNSNSTEGFFSHENSNFGSSDDGQSGLFPDGTFFYSDCSCQQMFVGKDSLEGSKVGENSGAGDSVDEYDNLCEIKPVLDLEEPRKEVDIPEGKKRCRDASDQVDKSKKSIKSNKYQKVVAVAPKDEPEQERSDSKRPGSMKEDSNGSPEVTAGEASTSKSSKAKKASKKASSDPQSLYARKRRERINERLRILQSLVPNGTKVDISTMLEEAVQYVKFLQLQIKLLSSDETWMYAPLAYNGMDIGISNFDMMNTSPR